MRDNTVVTPARSRQVSAFHILAYVLPSIPLAALGLPIVVHLPQFYASREIGLGLGVTGLVFSLCRIADVFVDPMMGYISDRLRTRWGRRRPLVVLGTPLLILGIWMVFVPGGPVSAAYLSFWLFLMYVAWSMVTIPHLSWGSELSTDYHERSRIYGWSQAAIIVGMVGVLVLPAVLENLGGYSHETQIMAMALFAIVLLIPAVALCAGVLPEPAVKLKPHAPIVATLRFFFRDRALRRVILVDLISSTTAGAVGAMFFFFARFSLGLPKEAGTLLLVYFVSGFLCIPFWIWLSRRIGKHRTILASFAWTIVLWPCMLLITPGDATIAFPAFALAGANYGAPSFLLRSMMADIADIDAAENNAERAGIMYSLLTLTSKFGLGWSVGISFGILSWVGFDPKIANSPASLDDLRVVFIMIPVVFTVVNFAIMRGYPLDEISHRGVRDEVERRRAAQDGGEGAPVAAETGDITDLGELPDEAAPETR